MALVIEDGSVVANANSYVTIAEFETFASDRGIDLTGSNGDSEQVLLLAMDYLETLTFIGTKGSKDQSLQWPRTGVYIDGYSIDGTEIPKDLKLAQYEVALAIDAGNNPLSTIDRETKREKVGDIEVEYTDGAKPAPDLRAADARLNKLVYAGSSGTVIPLMRA